MIQFPDQPATDYTDPNGVDWIYNGAGWERKPFEPKSENPSLNNEIIYYEWDAFSLYNGVYSPNIYPGSSAYPSQLSTLYCIDNENHLMTTTPDESIPGFYWVKNNGSRVTTVKYLPYVNGENGQGQITQSTLQHGMGRSSVQIDGVTHILAGNSNTKDLIRVTFDGAELVGKVATHVSDDQWSYETNQSCANDETSRPTGLVQSSDTELTAVSMGTSKNGSYAYPMISVKTFSIADCSVINTYYSATNLSSGVSGNAKSWAEFFPDRRNPKNMIVIAPYYWEDESPAYIRIAAYYVDTEAGTVDTIDLGRASTSDRLKVKQLRHCRVVPVSDDLFSVEVIGKFNGDNQFGVVGFYVKLPADRQNMSGAVSGGTNPHIYKRESKGYKDTYDQNFGEIDRENYGVYLHHRPLGGTINSMSVNQANTAGYSMAGKNPSNYIIQYVSYSHRYTGFAADGGNIEGLDEGRGMIDIKPASMAPARYYTGGYTTAHDVGLLGWRPDTGAGIFALRDANNGNSQYIILVQPAAPDNLRTMARVKDGKVVEGPLRGLEAGVDTSGDDWFRVYPMTKEDTTFEASRAEGNAEENAEGYTKFVSDEVVFVEEVDAVVQYFDEVPLTDSEVAEAKAMEAEELAAKALLSDGESE